MKKRMVVMLSLLFASLAGAVSTPLLSKHGDIAPEFVAHASLAGKSFKYSLKDALSKGPVVVYFYPSAFTGGCNIQAREFAINMDNFAAENASVIGVSMDNIERLNDFSSAKDFCGGKFPVASDPNGVIASSFGLKHKEEEKGAKDTRGEEIGHGFIERVTFVVAKDGKIAKMIEGVPPAQHVSEALKQVKQLRSAK